jgi:hypothetical protein
MTTWFHSKHTSIYACLQQEHLDIALEISCQHH